MRLRKLASEIINEAASSHGAQLMHQYSSLPDLEARTMGTYEGGGRGEAVKVGCSRTLTLLVRQLEATVPP